MGYKSFTPTDVAPPPSESKSLFKVKAVYTSVCHLTVHEDNVRFTFGERLPVVEGSEPTDEYHTAIVMPKGLARQIVNTITQTLDWVDQMSKERDDAKKP
jgi:hypothetical protein